MLLLVVVASPIAPATAFDAAAAAKALAPLVDEQTIVIGHVDVVRWDVPASLKLLRELAPDDPLPPAADPAVISVVERFRAAGGGELFIVLSLADLPGGGPLAAVPLGPDSNEEELRELVGGQENALQTKRVGDLLIIGTKATIQRRAHLKPTPRPELAVALAAAGDSPVRAILVPTLASRRAMEEIMPRLPAELGGGSSAPIARGLQWISVGVDLPPKMGVQFVAQATDAKAAQDLSTTWTRMLATLLARDDVRKVLPAADQWNVLLSAKPVENRVLLNFDEGSGRLPALRAIVAAAVHEATLNARRNQASNQLHNIGIAMHNYGGASMSLPPAVHASNDGKPLLSWRVLLLPYLEQNTLFDEFRLDEPWDSEHNKKLIAKMPAVYACPGSKAARQGKTVYLTARSEASAFPGQRGIGFREITDGTSKTVMVVEASDDRAVEWTKPEDWTPDLQKPLAGLGGHFSTTFCMLMCDASVQIVSLDLPAETMRRLIARNDKLPVELP